MVDDDIGRLGLDSVEQLASLFDENGPEPAAMAIPPLTKSTSRGAGSGAGAGAPSYGGAKGKIDIGRAVKQTSLQAVRGKRE